MSAPASCATGGSCRPLPPHFVSRDGALAVPRQIVTGDRAERLVGLHGMGGLGRTVLAQALCHDPVVQAAFPDGIIWLTIGPGDVELLEQLQEAGRCLDDSPGEYATRDGSSWLSVVSGDDNREALGKCSVESAWMLVDATVP